jgi:hypothetical protein
MRIYFKITDDRPPGVSIRRWRTISRDGMAQAGFLYEGTYKHRHFEEGAAARYGYQPRTAAHRMKKARMVAPKSFKISPDANRDLIMSGLLRKAIKMRHAVRAFPTRVTVNMPSPNYAQMKPRRPNMPNLGAEIAATSTDEQLEMETAIQTSIENDLNKLREPKTIQIG